MKLIEEALKKEGIILTRYNKQIAEIIVKLIAKEVFQYNEKAYVNVLNKYLYENPTNIRPTL